ncbi:carbohydrate ABC transporter permease [soil metagenome]
MATTGGLSFPDDTTHLDPRAFDRWQARRRWAKAGLIYAVMLAFAIVFIGPILFAAVSSIKTDPLEYPPSLAIPQLQPKNWSASARLGAAGAGDRLFGGFAPGAVVPFEITYFVREGLDVTPPEVVVPRRRPGAGPGAVLAMDFAADYASVGDLTIVRRQPSLADETGAIPGELVTFAFTVAYVGEGPTTERLPLDVTAEVGMTYVDSTITASRLERRGRTASFENAAPGVLGYVFRNYVRVFNEVRTPATRQSLFLVWIGNSFVFAFFRIIITLLLASMAGYALARLRFRGREAIFMLVLFAQMVPLQVLFISNYLVLRDGIVSIDGFKLSTLWGFPDGMLNSLTGLLFVTALNAGAVFIMKQFFESIPREVEEAAMIDGASHWRRYWSVVLPMARPALGALTIITFQGAWNDFFWPFIVLTSPETMKTLPIGLLSFRNIYGGVGDWGLILAGAILSALPVIVLFVVFQRYFLEGVSFGGGKE